MLLSARNILESLMCDRGSRKDYEHIGENKLGLGAKWLDFDESCGVDVVSIN